MAAKKKIRPVKVVKGAKAQATANRGGTMKKTASGNRGGSMNRPAPGSAGRPPARRPKQGRRPRPGGAGGR